MSDILLDTHVETINKIMDGGVEDFEDIIGIMAVYDVLKSAEVNIYSHFDDESNLISRYGIISDIDNYLQSKIIKHVAFPVEWF